jgi:hypothetical protein
MTQEVSAAEEIVESRELWHIQFREDETFPWKSVGTERAALGETIRTYDFWVEKHADVEVRMLRTVVTVEVADVEKLREKSSQQTAETTDIAVPSE